MSSSHPKPPNPHHNHNPGPSSGRSLKISSVSYFPFCPEISKYEKLAKVGEGTFGEVFKARDRKTNHIVALKKVRMENEKEGIPLYLLTTLFSSLGTLRAKRNSKQFPMTSLREIRILQLLNHENIVPLVEICRAKATPYNRDKGSIYLVCDFCEHDLAGLLNCEDVKFSLSEIKSIMHQLFSALDYIHGCRILHRDMKSSNILITKGGVLKLADFGLARALSKGASQRYTNRVVTLWYRPPELLLGERNYGPPIDIWGAGCIMCEMWTRRAIMQGESEQHQITLISQLCGSITPEVYPGVENLELYSKLELPKDQKRKIKERLKHYVKDSSCVDLIDKLLVLDPKKRLDSDACLEHDMFVERPFPSRNDLANKLTRFKSSMFVMHTNRQGARQHGPGGAGGGGAAAQVASNVHDRVF